MQTPAAEDRPMWISSTRLAEQHTTAYTGLDDVQHMGFAEQRDGGDDASTRRHTKAERTRRTDMPRAGPDPPVNGNAAVIKKILH